MMTLDEVRQLAPTLPATISPEMYAKLTNTGRTKVYEMLRAGEFPVPYLKTGTRYQIPTMAVLRMLGLEEPVKH
jgi:excisionase family DNA binding protein